jgi:hypothetical protein
LYDQVASYTSCREAPQPEGSRILDAPREGGSLFSGVERDDRLEVGFSVNSAWIPPGLSVLQLVRILGDLEETVVLLNLMG